MVGEIFGGSLIAALALAILVGCGAGDDIQPDAEVPGQGAAQPEWELPPGEVPLAELRRARGAINVIERQAANVADATLTRGDLLPSTQGAELLIERGYIDESEFCAAVEVIIEVDARGTDADLHAAADSFGSVWQEAAPERVADLGATVFNGLFVHCQ